MSEEDETWMEKSIQGRFVLFTDYQAALAEKEREIERLKCQVADFQRWLSHGVYYTNEEYEEQVRKPKLKLQADLDHAVEKAVMFADWLRIYLDTEADENQDARAFLASPLVQSWQARQEK